MSRIDDLPRTTTRAITVCTVHGPYVETLCPDCVRAKDTSEEPTHKKPTNPKDRAAVSKPDLSLFPDTAVLHGALAMIEGDAKYGGYNYRVGGVLASVYVAACRRHLAAWFNGEDEDPDSHVHHLGNALACIAVLIDAMECGVLRDDRPPKCNVAQLTRSFVEKVKHLQKLYPDGPERYTEEKHGKKE